MSLLKKFTAYYTGYKTCSAISIKAVPAKVYYYNEDQLRYFLSGVLNAKHCLVLSDKIVYPARSFSYLYMLKMRFKEAGIKAEVNYDLTFRCLMIDKNELIPFIKNKTLKLGKRYNKLLTSFTPLT